MLEQAAAAAERAIDLLVNAVLKEEVVDLDLLLPLADAVNAADALLDLAGVPGQVVIDQGAGRLQVQAFAGGVVADEVAVLYSSLAELDRTKCESGKAAARAGRAR